LRFHPRDVEELDEHERHQDQHEHRSGQQDDAREESSQIGVERDVAEPQRGHHDQHPVDRRRPTVLLPFQRHQHVKSHGVDRHQHGEGDQQPAQDPEIAAPLRVGQEAQDNRE
jgi:hypothetical protein